MPIYEYLCENCGRIFSYLVLKKEEPQPVCKFCGGLSIKRIISRVNVFRSEEKKIERLTDPSRWGDLESGNLRAFERWIKEVGSEMEGEVDRQELEKVFHEAVEDIEKNKEDAV